MRIGLDISSVAHGAGIGRYTRGLAGALAETARQPGSNLELVFFSRRSLPADLRAEALRPAEIVVLPSNRVLYDQTRLPRAIRGCRLDVYHSPDYVLPRAEYGVASVVTVHDLSFYDCPESVSARALWLYRQFVPPSLEKAEVIIADSEFTAGRIRERFPAVADRVSVVHPGIPDETGGAPATSKPAGSDPEPREMLFVGTVEPRKNLPLALSVYRELKERGARLSFVIIGRGGRGAGRILEEAAKIPGVRYMAVANDQELEMYYRRARLFIYPSLYEGFGYPPVEAMAWGCPVVAASTSALPESVNGGGLVVEPTRAAFVAACRKLLDDPVLWEEFRRRGKAQAEKFRWRKVLPRVLALYAEAARRSRER